MKKKYIHISRSWTKYGPDGNLADFGIKIIKHAESYAQWNDQKNDWDYVNIPYNCEICLERKKEANQLELNF